MGKLFVVNNESTSSASPASRQTLSALNLWERRHLQEWVLANPEVLGEDVLVVTSEYDRWSAADGTRARDRLDVLGLDASGRLVVVELKRGEATGDVHLQAITYAALVSRFTLETLAEAHRAFLASRGETVSTADASGRLLEHVGGELDEDLIRRPRLALIAESFPRQVTHTAVWISEQGIDISLTSVTMWQVGEQTVADFSQVYPTPEAEEFTLAPMRAETVQAVTRAQERARAATTVKRLVNDRALPDGTALHFTPAFALPASDQASLDSWLEEDPSRSLASWRNDPVKPLTWAGDGSSYTPTALAQQILRQAAGVERTLRGPSWWTTDDGVDLATLAGDAPGAGRVGRDWSVLHRIVHQIPPGRWATYGDVAAIVGTAPQPLGGHLMRCPECDGAAHRIISSNGTAAYGFEWSDPARTDTVEEVLTQEGVQFTRGVADPAQRLRLDALRALLGENPS